MPPESRLHQSVRAPRRPLNTARNAPPALAVRRAASVRANDSGSWRLRRSQTTSSAGSTPTNRQTRHAHSAGSQLKIAL